MSHDGGIQTTKIVKKSIISLDHSNGPFKNTKVLEGLNLSIHPQKPTHRCSS